MSSHRPRALSPLTDRLLSNSPASDSVKSSILRESGLGWNTGSPPPGKTPPVATTPLRISKRDSPHYQQHQHPSQLARRSSSTYKKLGKNNLVSKSPFKSQIPTSSFKPSSPAHTVHPKRPSAHAFLGPPVPRKVSGEKRPRPLSMQEQAENEREFAYKRERRQSKTYQGLVEKEPVTRSPFKQSTIKPKPSGADAPLPPLPSSAKENSPTRSSLVSKRLHGPRLSVSGADGRRQRRKTVTFDEQCDVVEFDRQSCEDDPFMGDDNHDDDIEMVCSEERYDEELSFEDDRHQADHSHGDVNDVHHDEQDTFYDEQDPEDHFENVPLEDGDDSITGMVNSMLNSPNAQVANTRTPSPALPLPPDPATNVEDGIPYGHSYHMDRVRSRELMCSTPLTSSPRQQFPFDTPSPIGDFTTPPSHRHVTSPLSGSPITNLSPGSRIPLGRSTHIERRMAEKAVDEEVEDDVAKLPPSPSPAKPQTKRSMSPREGLVPRFGIQVIPRDDLVDEEGNDPFAIPGEGHQCIDLSFNSHRSSDEDSMDPANLSIGHSEVSLSGLEMELGLMDDKHKISGPKMSPRLPTAPTEESDSNHMSNPIPHGSPSLTENVLPPAISDPLPRVRSPTAPQAPSPLRKEADFTTSSGLSSSGSINGRTPRISREDVQRRLLRKRSTESPAPEERPVEPLPQVDEEEERKRMSVMTDFDISAETAIVGTAERCHLTLASIDAQLQPKAHAIDLPHMESEGLKFDLSQFSIGSVDVEMKSALDRLMDDVAGSSSPGVVIGLKAEAVAEGVEAKRFDVDDSIANEMTGGNESQGTSLGLERPPFPVRSATTPDLFAPLSASTSRSTSNCSTPPPPPPKDAIRSREKLIIEKRREARQREEDEAQGFYTPPHPSDKVLRGQSRRRSRSTGDMDDLVRKSAIDEDSKGMLDISGIAKQDADDLSDSIQRELRKIGGGKSTYHIKEQATIYASSSANRISHMQSVGDVNAGKAWRPVRRPSDMNEYSKQIKELRAQEKPGKAHGKVFVRVLAIKSINIPIPSQPTAVTCTLNNGIHFVTTPECQFGRDCRIEQEFELIEHSKLEFTLTMKIRRDPHIIQMFKSIAPHPERPATSSKGGMRSFFSSSPKKSSKAAAKQATPPPLADNLARYLKPDGTLARAFISFKDIAARCDTRLLETTCPLIGQRIETSGSMSTVQVGELVLQVFRLPPLPGIPPNDLPQSLEECHRGLRHTNWHKQTYFEGTLTQQGGDCMTWRRRQFRVIGANLVSFNDVTKKATTTIGLKKAIAVQDEDELRARHNSPATACSRFNDDYDGVGGIERSFRLFFPNNEEITFFADTDEEKARWLEVLRALVSHIPPNPLWAEVIWQRQEELRKQTVGTSELSRRPMLTSSARPSQDMLTKGQR